MLVGITVIVILVLAVCFFFVWPRLSTYVINKMKPTPAAGTYPAEIAGMKLTGDVDSPHYYSNSKETAEFNATYSDGTHKIPLNERLFSTAEEARSAVSRGDQRVGDYHAVQTDSRQISYTTDEHPAVEVWLAEGNYAIHFTAEDTATALKFENGLPYAAFGASPVLRADADYPPQPVFLPGLLEKFNKDPQPVAATYNGQKLLLYGIVTEVTNVGGNPAVVVGSESSATIKHSAPVNFRKTDADKVTKLRVRDYIVFRGEITANAIAGLIGANDAELIRSY